MIKTLMLVGLSLITVSGFTQLKSKSSKTHPPIQTVQKADNGHRTLSVSGRDVRDTSEIQILYILQENGDTTSLLGVPGYEIHAWFVPDNDPQHPSDAGIGVFSHEWQPLVQFKDYVLYYKRPKTVK